MTYQAYQDYRAHDKKRTKNMPTIEQAKLAFLHKKTVERYEREPNSEDEESLILFDHGSNHDNIRKVYLSMGVNEHPVFPRQKWVDSVASKQTDDGYWPWVTNSLKARSVYHYDGDRFSTGFPTMPSAPRPTLFDAEPVRPAQPRPRPRAFSDAGTGPMAVRDDEFERLLNQPIAVATTGVSL